jgi:hypothetical protein
VGGGCTREDDRAISAGGGTADPAWDSTLASRLSRHVFTVEGADHGMYVPGPLSDSIEVLGHVVVSVEKFLDTIEWAT